MQHQLNTSGNNTNESSLRFHWLRIIQILE